MNPSITLVFICYCIVTMVSSLPVKVKKIGTLSTFEETGSSKISGSSPKGSEDRDQFNTLTFFPIPSRSINALPESYVYRRKREAKSESDEIEYSETNLVEDEDFIDFREVKPPKDDVAHYD